jgi:predicted RNA-binding Zn-ribbon protein involved in translation (DUF1610 family)
MAAVILMAAATAFGLGLSKGRAASPRSRVAGPTRSDIKSMSRAEVEKLLEAVAEAVEPEPVMGAMCYAVMALPDVAEYVCPVCGGRTTYDGASAWQLQTDLPRARMLFGLITEASALDLTLDESSFCSICSPGSTIPALVLTVEYENGVTHSGTVNTFDLGLLEGLLSGQLTYPTWNDGTEPLKPHLDRLREMLGITPKPEAVEPPMGAMCYYMSASGTTSSEYVCPECGGRTAYPAGSTAADRAFLDRTRLTVDRIAAATGLTLALDEKGLCCFCSPVSGDPALSLTVVRADGSTVSTRVSGEELEAVAAALSDPAPSGGAGWTGERIAGLLSILS